MSENIYWPYVAGAMSIIAFATFVWAYARGHRSVVGLIVGLADIVIIGMNGAAPFRGLIDPNYIGFGFGFLQADKGIAVTIVAGGLILGSWINALVAGRNPGGIVMLCVALVSAFHVVNLGFPLLDSLLSDPAAVTIQFGEYLTVPYVIAIPAIVVVAIVPFLLAIPWALLRAFDGRD